MSGKTDKASGLDGTTQALMRRVWREWIRPYRGRLMVAFVLMAVLAAATGAYPLLIDRSYAMFETQDRTMMVLVPLVIVVVSVVKALSMYAQTVVTTDIVQRILTDVRMAPIDRVICRRSATSCFTGVPMRCPISRASTMMAVMNCSTSGSAMMWSMVVPVSTEMGFIVRLPHSLNHTSS